MKKLKITARQVAIAAGVSPTTVSFVLNDVKDGNISEETRQRVLEAARTLNYVPDIAARSLARGRSNNIALILGQAHRQVFIDEYIPNILTGIRQAIQEPGYRILVEMIDDGAPPETYTRLFQGKEVAGMIVNLNQPTARDIQNITYCTAQGYPLVALDLFPDVYGVQVDKMDGVRQVVRHLIGLGHQRIACITFAPEHHPHSDERVVTFRKALEAAGLVLDPSLLRYGSYDPETGYEAMKSLIAEHVGALPTAVFGMNDMMAFGAIKALNEHGLRIPQDIAVVGFDDVRLAGFATPPLTTVYEPDVDHGRLAGEMLVQLINGEVPPQKHINLESRLVVRESCGASLR
ncbi:MAG TPA: LacI family DNA-binding transcriptional regulator [Phototrophicaceae bacterium]|jgi:LacI family transcriptional regulator|nr:LacI family DNA-binding transcriptional regulator [Phototrophicaceae bacterium]